MIRPRKDKVIVKSFSGNIQIRCKEYDMNEYYDMNSAPFLFKTIEEMNLILVGITMNYEKVSILLSLKKSRLLDCLPQIVEQEI